MRKSLHLTNAWHETSGGIRTFYQAMLRAAERRSHFMRMIVPGIRHDVEEVGKFGRIYYIKSPPAPLNREYRTIFPQHYLLPGARIPRILEDEKPDLVEVNDKYTLMYLSGMLRERMLGRIKWRPTTVGLSCERMDQNVQFYLSGTKLAQSFARLYMKWLYFPMFDHHVGNSEHTAEELKAASRGHKIPRCVWIRPMGVDLEQFSPEHRSQQVREELSRRFLPVGRTTGDAHPFYLLYAGRLAPEKNLFLLTDLMARLTQDGSIHLLVAGGGPLQREFEARARDQAPGKIHCLGHIGDRVELAKLYANADAFIHPNPNEPFGIAPLEAMASGLPLLVPNRGGVLAYASNENSWMTAPHAEDFAEAVRAIRRWSSEARRRAETARQTASLYSWDSVADLFFSLYDEIDNLRTGIKRTPSIEPSFISTVGDYWGREKDAVSSGWPNFENR